MSTIMVGQPAWSCNIFVSRKLVESMIHDRWLPWIESMTFKLLGNVSFFYHFVNLWWLTYNYHSHIQIRGHICTMIHDTDVLDKILEVLEMEVLSKSFVVLVGFPWSVKEFQFVLLESMLRRNGSVSL